MADNLVFKVIDSPAETNMTGHTKTFSMAGGSIGRSASNSWVLPDIERILSSIHARIVFHENNYFLTDQSTNGTFLNGSSQAIGKGQQIQLNDGDVISMGPYQLKTILKVKRRELPEGLESVDFLDTSDKTTIGSSADMAASPDQETTTFDQWLESPTDNPIQQDSWGSVDASANPQTSVDPLVAFSGNSASSDPWASIDSIQNDNDWWQDGTQPDNAPAIEQSIQTRKVAAAEPVPQANPAHLPPLQQSPDTGSQQLANQLGVEVKTQSDLDRIDQEAALLIRETASRLMDLLRARSTVKNELRVERTMIESQDNNPLKFSATVDDALNRMFGGNSNAFMSPSAAIKDSFDNISDHQIAVLVGMRSAYDAMLSQFAPDKLAVLFEQMNGKSLSMNRKARNWETFQKWFSDLQSDPEATYNQIFGEVFAEAYEKKLVELQSVRSIST